MKKIILSISFYISVMGISFGQDTMTYKLRLDIPLIEFPQNLDLPQKYPSMNQATKWSTDSYELGFWGIDELGNLIFHRNGAPISPKRSIFNGVFKYSLGLIFSKYASELPIPLGVWAHEEFHRTTLGVAGFESKNGNWILNRWDGTVYGLSDETLNNAKQTNLNQLLYSYVAGVQYEIFLNQNISINDFYKKRTLYKNSLLLYNAYYVYEYFNFSTSSKSDSVKVIAPQYEDSDPVNRDYAGADLTAWAYDMFNPAVPFTSRDPFPDGDGVNRRIGFSDLSESAQDYLLTQKKLSFLNFLNPSIYFINRIKVNENVSFNFFTQYSPTHYGNTISLFLPLKYKKYDLLFSINRYDNNQITGNGVGLGIFNYQLYDNYFMNLSGNIWNQPIEFMTNAKKFGGAINYKVEYNLKMKFRIYAELGYKSSGWVIGNPYLNDNYTLGFGLNYNLHE